MTRNLGLQLQEDRLLRNAAYALVKADVANLRADLASKGIGDRVIDRFHDGAVDIFEEAVGLADSNRGILAVLMGAVVLWFARNPILSLFTDDEDAEDYADERAEPV